MSLRELKDDIVRKVSTKSREGKFREFMYYFKPSPRDKILNVGVSNVKDSKVEENYFSRHYPYQNKMTGLGVGDLSNFENSFPKIKTISYEWEPERKFPFKDKEFDLAISNAVIEHVSGGYEGQKAFLKELVRVSDKGMLTTPNKWFPIEVHYKLPFVHWMNNDKFQEFSKNNLKYRGLVYLLGKNDLVDFCEEVEVPNYEIRGNKFLGMDMTFSLFWDGTK